MFLHPQWIKKRLLWCSISPGWRFSSQDHSHSGNNMRWRVRNRRWWEMCVSSTIHRHHVLVWANTLCNWFLQCTVGLTGVFCSLFRQVCISLRCDGARSNSSKMGWLGDVFVPWRRVLASSKALQIDSTGFYLSSTMHVRQLLRQVQSRVATSEAAGRWWGVCYSSAIHRHQVLVWIDRPCNWFLQCIVSLVIVFCCLFCQVCISFLRLGSVGSSISLFRIYTHTYKLAQSIRI